MLVNIGESYALSIGRTYAERAQNARMAKKSNRTVWSRIKEALIEAGMEGKQSEAAKILSIAQPSVSEWNQPNGYPSLDNARTLGLRLNVCVEWILTERGQKRPGPPPDPVAQDLWSVWGRLSVDDRHQVVGFAAGKVRPIGSNTPLREITPEQVDDLLS